MENELPPGASVADEGPPPPMEKAIVDANWKFRKIGFEELEAKFAAAGPTDPIFQEYGSLFLLTA
jgi:hypothetical protein